MLANKILAAFRQCLAGFWRVICTDLIDQKGRPLNQMIGLAVLQGDVK